MAKSGGATVVVKGESVLKTLMMTNSRTLFAKIVLRLAQPFMMHSLAGLHINRRRRCQQYKLQQKSKQIKFVRSFFWRS